MGIFRAHKYLHKYIPTIQCKNNEFLLKIGSSPNDNNSKEIKKNIYLYKKKNNKRKFILKKNKNMRKCIKANNLQRK